MTVVEKRSDVDHVADNLDFDKVTVDNPEALIEYDCDGVGGGVIVRSLTLTRQLPCTSRKL